MDKALEKNEEGVVFRRYKKRRHVWCVLVTAQQQKHMSVSGKEK